MSLFKLLIEIPGLPATTNGSHGTWHTAAAERRKWRNAVKAIAYMRRPETPLTKVKLTLTRLSSGKTDHDNRVISFKGVVDGLKDAQIILDDTDSVIVERHYPQEKAPRGKGSIRILVEEVL